MFFETEYVDTVISFMILLNVQNLDSSQHGRVDFKFNYLLLFDNLASISDALNIINNVSANMFLLEKKTSRYTLFA